MTQNITQSLMAYVKAVAEKCDIPYIEPTETVDVAKYIETFVSVSLDLQRYLYGVVESLCSGEGNSERYEPLKRAMDLCRGAID